MPARRRRLLAGLGVAIVLLPLVALVALHLPMVQRGLVVRVLDRLRTSADLDVTADRVRFSPTRLRVVAEGVRVAPARQPDAPLLVADRVEVVAAGATLTSLGRDIVLRHVVVEGPIVTVRRDATGRWNLPQVPESDTSSDTTFSLDEVQVRGGRVDVTDVVSGYVVALRDVAITTREPGTFATRADAEVQVADARLTGRVAGDLRYDSDTLALRDALVEMAHSRLAGSGSYDLPSGALALDATLDVAASDVALLVEVPGLSGTVAGSVQVTGTADAPVAGFSLTGQRLTDGALPPASATIEGRADLSGIELRTARLDVADGRIEAVGRVGLTSDERTTLKATVRGVSAETLLHAYAGDAPVATSVSGRVSVDGPGLDWRGWQAAADLQLRAPAVSPAAVLPVDGVATMRLDDGRWTLEANLAAPEAAVVVASLAGRLAEEVSASSVSGHVRIDVDDLAVAAPRLAGGPVDVAGRASLDARIAGTLAAPHADWALDGTASTSVLAPVVVAGRGTATPQAVHATALSATRGTNSVTADLRVGLSGARPLSGRMTGRLPDLGGLLSDPAVLGWPLAGAGTVQGELGGTVAAPLVRADITLTDAALAGQRIDSASADVTVRGTRVQVGFLEARAGEGRLTGALDADLARETHTADVALTDWPVDQVPATETLAEVPLTGRVSGRLETAGSWRRPTGTADLALRDVTWQGEPLSTASLRARSDGTRATVALDAPEWRTTGQGEIRLDDDYPFDMSLSTRDLTLEPFRPWLPGPLQDAAATATADVSVTGRASDAATSTVTARLVALALELDDARLELEAPATIVASQHVIRVDGLRLRSGDLAASISGGFGRGPADEPLTLTLAGDVAAGRPWLRAWSVEAPQLAGALDLQATVAGTTDAPRPSAHLVVSDFTATPERRPGVALAPVTVPRVEVTLDAGVVTLAPVMAEWQQARLTAAGRVPLRIAASQVPPGWHAWLGEASGPATLEARGDGLEVGLLAPLLAPGTLDGISGAVTATLDMQARDATMAGVTGVLQLEEAAFTLVGVPLAQARPTVVRLDAGRLLVKDILFTGPNTDIALDGDADLTRPSPTFDMQLRGLTNLALLRPLLPGVAPGGRAEIDLRAAGSLDAPNVTGKMLLTDASLRIAEPRLAIELLNGTATFTGRQMALPALRGVANGAPLTLSAALALASDNSVGGQVRLRSSGLPLEYPEGLRTEADVDLLASVVGTRVDVTGTVDVLRGTYREPVALTALTSALLSSSTPAPLAPDAGAPLDVRFDIQVATRDDLVVDNNYGRFAAGGAVRLLGTMDTPGLSGRITLREGGELYLSGLTYRVERGLVDFANPARIEPIVDLAAETRTRGERVRVEASGTPDTLEVSLSAPDAAVPPSQADLASLLVSGRSLEGLSGQAAGEQALGLLSADLLGGVGRGIGLDALRLDRDLLLDERTGTGEIDLAGETDPVARLTLAKRLRSNVEVTFSQNLRDANEITWLVSWRPVRRVELRLLHRDDRSMSYEFRHEVVFGAPPAQPRTRETPVRVRSVDVVAGDPALVTALQRRLKLGAGDRFDFYRWQADRDRLESWLFEQRYAEHRLVSRRAQADDDEGPVVDLRYEVTAGPRVLLEVRGAELGADVRARMREAWHGSVFDGFLQEDLSRLAREALLQDGHPLADVQVAVTLSADGLEKTAVVSITPGPRAERRLDVTGLDANLTARFEAWLAQGAERLAWLDAPAFQSASRNWLRSRGALDADVRLSPPTVDAGTARMDVHVDHGTPYVIGRIVLSGVPAGRIEITRGQLGLSPGQDFDALTVQLAARDLQRWYIGEGFGNAAVAADPTVHVETRTVDLDVRVSEGSRAVVVASGISGEQRTHRALLDRALALPMGAVVTPQTLLAARQRLYDTGVLASADVETTPVGPAVETADGTIEQPVQVTATVQEQPRLRLRYGLALNDDVLQAPVFRPGESRQVTPGLSALLENRNLFGRALTGGLSARYERARQTGRAFLTSPFLFGRDFRVQLSSGLTRSRVIPDLSEGPVDVRTDATVGVIQRLPGLEGLRLTYGYRFERSRTYTPSNPDDFDITIAAPRLTSTVYIDRRDDPAAATRGWFHASTVEVTRGWLGSDYEFVTYYGQQTAFHSIGRLVLAGRAQVGLGRAFAGQDLLESERFMAGGAVSVRGYRDSSVGEYNEVLELARGDGTLVLNGEVRLPLWRWISGVAFVDGGGVFPRVSDFGVRDMQWGAGAGVRVSTPAGLVRMDVGVPINRRAIDKAWRLYIGLGHVF